jgi:hypothetical protein
MSAMIPGVEIEMVGRTWIVPPLTIGQIRRLSAEFALMRNDHIDLLDPQSIVAAVKVVTAAMQRNYPELTEGQVEEALDLRNAPVVMQAILGASGLQRGTRPGEAPAAPGDGTNSTASSPPPSDIAPAISTNSP